MTITLSDLAQWIDKSLTEPAPLVVEAAGDYYSPYYNFMYTAALMLPGGALVELGVETGRGLAALALSGNWVVGIDHTYRKELDPVLDRFPNITFLHQNSNPPPDILIKEKIALLHIDTEHSFSQARAEFEAYKSLLTNPAVVVFDDLHAMDDGVMNYFISLSYPKIVDDRMHPQCGWGVLLYGT